MPVLQINQQPGGAPNRYRISVRVLDLPACPPLSFDADIGFELKPADAERIRWYLEDYLQFTEAPAPQIAQSVEDFMTECGEELFREIFRKSDDAARLWNSLEPYLSTTRIEVATGIAEATTIPWELIRDPDSRTFLALSAAAFVRSQRESRIAQTVASEVETVRILLVISRPGGGGDVPFRSVASRLVTQLNEEARGAFALHVLRPPTFEQLRKTLERAHDAGSPYHIVHFDGHGTYDDPGNLELGGPVLSNIAAKGGTATLHGFLAFENAESKNNIEFVDGFSLGALLRLAHVPVLVLNACQSAFVEARPKPEMSNPADTRAEVEAYGSLAQAVMSEGAAGVVAMRYTVYVNTAAQFVAELYGALARGRRLGEAVTSARRILHTRSDRHVAYEPRPLQDWSVPTVWERAPLRLWPEKTGSAPLKVFLDEKSVSMPAELDQTLPPRPDFGFFGRDETLYALDRAFDTQRIVLLHAYAGSGKTSTAAEFARWYALTGGVDGLVLFTSFERHLPLARVLDKIGAVFGQVLEGAGIQWDAITNLAQRRGIALQVLQQVPVLWIWDNVEPVNGFPAGTASDWSAAEQQELLAFLRAARDTSQAKFLLTSRRDESAWLGELALRVDVPDMPMQERLQLAGAIVGQRGKRLAALPDLRPLLKFTHGNPLTILVTVGEALRAGIDTSVRLDTFVAALQGGEVTFEDEQSEGRSKSLGASLSYGFGAAFNENERKILALLHLFQGFVDIDILVVMGNPDNKWCVDAVRDLTRERGIVLLDRAAEIGLLKVVGNGYFGIHPALPWYFRTLFEKYFSEDSGNACRAFVDAMGAMGDFYHHRFYEGDHEILNILAAEEDNLLAALRLARALSLWDRVIANMQGLRTLYETTGRRSAWRRLVQDVVPDFVDAATDGPLPGREDDWSLVTEYRVDLVIEKRNWIEAERLQRARVDWNRRRAQHALTITPKELNSSQRNTIRSLAASLQMLGIIQRNQGSSSSIVTMREALDLVELIGDSAGVESCAFNLGRIYMDIADLRDFDEAERWYRQSLAHVPPGDAIGRGKSLGQLGIVAFQRFLEAAKAERPVGEQLRHLNEAARLYHEVLDLMPASAVDLLSIAHNQLGAIYSNAGDVGRALHHYRQGIRFADEVGDLFGAGTRRYNAALALLRAGRLPEAQAYAEAALVNFQSFGDRAAEQISETENLIAILDQESARSQPPS